jgi:TonB-linked SusC/RagA family outer membrane protein
VLAQHLTLVLDGVSLKEALATIAHKASFELTYSDDVLPVGKTVHFRADRISVAAALTELLLDARVDVLFSPDGSATLVRRRATVGLQVGTIAGTVTDAKTHEAIAAATVVVEGTGLGALTDADGKYRVQGVPAGSHTVVIRRIGYRQTTQLVTVSADRTTTADFALLPTASQLEATVVTATGQTERARATGVSIGTINIDSVPLAASNTVSDVLSSRVPGVAVDQPNGIVGSAARIRIRGSNSISLSNDPLIIVDGIRVDGGSNSAGISTGASGPSRINDISPDDIADIQVIKGPAAASLYGTAAANGVIQITTKRGQQGKARFEAFAETGTIHQATVFPANYSQIGMTPRGQRVTGCNILVQATGVCAAVADSLASWNPLEQVSPFVAGSVNNYGLSASGGSGATTYYMGGSYQREQGIYETNRLRNVDARANIHSQLRDNLDVALSAGYVDGHLSRPQDGDNFGSMISSGLFGRAFDDPSKHGYFYATPEKGRQIKTEQDVHRFTGSATGNYKPLHWLTLTGVGGMDYVNQQDALFVAPGVFTSAEAPTLAQGRRSLVPVQVFNYTANGSAVARYALKKIGALATSTIGVQYNRSTTAASSASGQSLAPGTQSLAGATALFTVGESHSGIATLGYLAQQQLAWNDRVFLTGGIRTDRTSAFGTNFKHVYYPAGSLSWVIGDESFFPKTDLVSSLRLRTAYGTSGQNPYFRQAITYYRPTAVALGGAVVPGVSIGGTGNADLRPEKSKEFEVGFDAGLFRDRVNAEFTFYHKVTDDALVAQQLPPSLGTSTTRFINIGEMRNSGTELLVHGRVLDTRPVSLDLTVDGTTTHNEVVDLGEGIAPIITLYQRVQTGYPFGSYFGNVIKSYSDANHNGLIEPGEIVLGDEATYIGTPFPTRTLAVTPTVTLFGNVRISALVDYRGGQKLFDYNEAARCALFENCRAIQDPNAPLADQAKAVAARSLGTYAGYVEDASFTKLREVAVTFDVPARLARRAGASRLSVTLAGRNLHTWTNYKGIDPEANISTDGFTMIDIEATPQVRYYTARINVTW